VAEPTPPAADPHFIGWLPMPRAYARFLAPVAAGLLVAAAVAAGLIARGQRSPGPGRWDDQPTTFEGVVSAEPYAMIRVPAPDAPGTAATVLLVEEGKFGAKDRARAFDGQLVRVTGTLLHRDGVRMLELAAGEDGLRPAPHPETPPAHLRRPAPRALGPVALRGEIVDSKCYLGAMKPGGGRTHKGCAVLCLRGGVPPLFVSPGRGETAAYLLTDPAGGPLGPAFFRRAGDPVRIHGTLSEWGDLSVIAVTSVD